MDETTYNGITTNDLEFTIPDISNYYGTLTVFKKGERYFWGIENYYTGEFGEKEIPKYLYEALVKYMETT